MLTVIFHLLARGCKTLFCSFFLNNGQHIFVWQPCQNDIIHMTKNIAEADKIFNQAGHLNEN